MAWQSEMVGCLGTAARVAVIPAHLDSHNFGCVGPIGVWPIGHETRLIMAHFC